MILIRSKKCGSVINVKPITKIRNSSAVSAMPRKANQLFLHSKKMNTAAMLK
jgi:hypothetical protein